MNKQIDIKSRSLREAIERKDLKEAKYWIDQEPESISAYDDSGFSPLEVAVHAGVDFVKLLIRHDVDVNGRDASGSLALHMAIRCEKVKIVRLLIEAGADVHIRSNDDFDAIHSAIYAESVPILKYLLSETTVDLATKNRNKEGYLEFCLRQSGHGPSELAVILIDSGLPLDQLKPAHDLAVRLISEGYQIDPQYLKVIDDRLLAISEKDILEKVTKVVEQKVEALEEGLTPSRPSKQKKRAL